MASIQPNKSPSKERKKERTSLPESLTSCRVCRLDDRKNNRQLERKAGIKSGDWKPYLGNKRKNCQTDQKKGVLQAYKIRGCLQGTLLTVGGQVPAIGQFASQPNQPRIHASRRRFVCDYGMMRRKGFGWRWDLPLRPPFFFFFFFFRPMMIVAEAVCLPKVRSTTDFVEDRPSF